MPRTHRVILDTDIGSDVDDLMALALILGTPTIDLLGVTTVYGDTALRARIARRVLSLAGREIPVHAGESTPLSGREVWWAGHEGALYPDLDAEHYDSDAAAQYLVDTVLAAPGEIDIIAIGPLTNIAKAITADPRFANAVRHLWVMGGAFADREPEHNFRSDDTAARQVFGSGIPTTITGLEITRKIHIDHSDLERIAASGELGRLINDEIRQWWQFWNTEWNVPHDPVTVLTMTDPSLFQLGAPGTVHIHAGDDEGVSDRPAGDGNTRIVVNLDVAAVSKAIVDGIVHATRPTTAAGKAT
ncbi:nucleoside hydrolase [Microbacter sp. GSS18]|nr:nucleoside hydrolase [Microbacter sp. GSS18]